MAISDKIVRTCIVAQPVLDTAERQGIGRSLTVPYPLRHDERGRSGSALLYDLTCPAT